MSKLKIVRRIKAPIRAVFDAFVDPAKIALWWGPDAGPVFKADVDGRVGGRFHIRFRMEDGSEHGSSGTFVTFDPPNRLVMSWSWESEPEVTSQIEVRFREVEGETEMTFVHAQLPDDAARDSHESGWNEAFDKLEARAGDLA